jgi:hypothetical protein
MIRPAIDLTELEMRVINSRMLVLNYRLRAPFYLWDREHDGLQLYRTNDMPSRLGFKLNPRGSVREINQPCDHD